MRLAVTITAAFALCLGIAAGTITGALIALAAVVVLYWQGPRL
jgi:hypothetical protein